MTGTAQQLIDELETQGVATTKVGDVVYTITEDQRPDRISYEITRSDRPSKTVLWYDDQDSDNEGWVKDRIEDGEIADNYVYDSDQPLADILDRILTA